jgi:Coenzyme PQQ synthesis protein D (PqqD)
VLAVNLDTGTYYSMPGLSGLVWTWVINGVPLADVTKSLLLACNDVPQSIEADVEAFVSQLHANGLILPSAGEPKQAPALPLDKQSFKPLLLEVYTDMQDLLLLDPMHDVAEAGWPLAKPEE